MTIIGDQSFSLHPQLEHDCHPLGDFPLCRVLLMKDCQYPWLILVPRRPGLKELHELEPDDLQSFMVESMFVSRQLSVGYGADKMNIAALGNVVPQLHIHHIVRYRTDPAWPAPLWGRLPAVPYSSEALLEQRSKLHDLLASHPNFQSVKHA